MSISWTVTELNTVDALEGRTDVATTATVICYWDNGDGKRWYPVTKRVGLNCDNVGSNPNFTNYSAITLEQAVSWAKAGLGTDMVNYMESEVTALRLDATTPKSAPQPLVPWE